MSSYQRRILMAIASVVGSVCLSQTFCNAAGYSNNSTGSSWGSFYTWSPTLGGTLYPTTTVTIGGQAIHVTNWYEEPTADLYINSGPVPAWQTLDWHYHVNSVSINSSSMADLTAGSTPRFLMLESSNTALSFGNSSALSFTLGGIDNPMYLYLTQFAYISLQQSAQTVQVGAQIQGPNGFIKNGAGTLQLTCNDNTYGGYTEIAQGTLAISTNGQLGNSTLVLYGGTLRADASFSLSHPVMLLSNGTTPDIINTQGATITLTGQISGNGTLTKQGVGTLTISSDKTTGTGEILVSGGILAVSSSTFTTGSSSAYSVVGYSGTGTLTQSAGTSTYNSAGIVLGFNTGDIGTYNLQSGAVLKANSLYVGNYGTGTFNQTTGSTGTIGNVIIQPSSAYNISGDVSTTTFNTNTIANYGNLTQTGGTVYGNVSLTNSGIYTLSGGALATAGTVNAGTFNQSNGSIHLIIGPFSNQSGATYTLSGTTSQLEVSNSYGKGSMVNNGTFTETGGIASLMNLTGIGSFTISGGTLTISGAKNTLGSLNISGTGTAQAVGNGAVLEVSGLSIGSSNKLDLENNDLIWHNGNMASITQWLAAGRGTGTWNGTSGIVSTTAADGYGFGVLNGSVYNALYGSSFDGCTVGPNDVVVKYTWAGDINLDGHVTATDFAQLDASYLKHIYNGGTSDPKPTWLQGDLNYDGKIDASDYAIINHAYSLQPSGSGNLAYNSPMPTKQVLGGSMVSLSLSSGTGGPSSVANWTPAPVQTFVDTKPYINFVWTDAHTVLFSYYFPEGMGGIEAIALVSGSPDDGTSTVMDGSPVTITPDSGVAGIVAGNTDPNALASSASPAVVSTPEPATLSILGVGMALTLGKRRKR